MDRCDQLYFSSSQTAGFFDHQYLWKESINILDFLHQKEVAPGTTTFGWVWAIVPLIQSDRSILSSLMSLERIKWYLSSFCKEFVIKGRSQLRQPLSVGCCQLCYESNQIAGFFYQQFLWKVLAYFLDFLYGNICQMKVSDYLCYLSTCVGRVCPVMPLIPRLQHQCQRQFPTLSQRCSLTLSSCCYNVATTLSIGFLGHFTTDSSDFFTFIETWESYKSVKSY